MQRETYPPSIVREFGENLDVAIKSELSEVAFLQELILGF